MTDEYIAKLFAGVRTFGWHEDKRRRNRLAHGIDFEDAPRGPRR